MVVTGVAPVTGAFTPGIAAIFITVAAVAGNTAVMLPVLAVFDVVAPVTVKKFAAIPLKVNPDLAVNTMVAE
jgi:hypothetical protein